MVVVGISDTYVLGWPVSLPDEPVYAPAISRDSPFGSSIYLWPTRETGVGLHLLHRRYGRVLDSSQVGKIRDAIDEGRSIPFAEPTTPADDRVAMEHSDEIIRQWESICFHQWPESVPGRTPLNPGVLRDIGIKPSQIGRILSIPSVKANLLHRGSSVPTAEQLDLLSRELQVDCEILAAPGMDEGTKCLLDPKWKEQLLQAGAAREVGEPTARSRVQEEFALAARSNRSVDDRIAAAIGRFREE